MCNGFRKQVAIELELNDKEIHLVIERSDKENCGFSKALEMIVVEGLELFEKQIKSSNPPEEE